MSSLTLFAACFVAGAASLASPCILPLVPVYLAAAACARSPREALAAPGRPVAPPALRVGARFTAGFVIVFVGLGAFSGGLASLLPAPTQARVAGVVLVTVGMVGLDLLPAPPVNRLLPTSAARNPVVLGVVFALAATPCTTPLLGVGLAAALAGATAGKGALLLASYGAGLATAMVAVGSAVGGVIAGVARRRSELVMQLAAAVTSVFGLVLALGQEWRLSVAARHLLDWVAR